MWLKDIAEWNKIVIKKSQKSEEEQGEKWNWKMEVKICNFLSTLFLNKDFLSQESPISADVKNNFIELES